MLLNEQMRFSFRLILYIYPCLFIKYCNQCIMFFDIFELSKLVFNYFQQYFSYICGENLTIHCENHQPAESFWQTLCTLINLHQAYLRTYFSLRL
jgi:hypothetical protein